MAEVLLVSAEKVLIAGMAARFPAANVATETPANLADVLPFYRVRTIAGTDDHAYDHPVVDVDTFALGAEAAVTAAELARAYLRSLPGQTVAGVYVNSVETVTAPRWTAWDNTNVRRYTASYRFTLHTI